MGGQGAKWLVMALCLRPGGQRSCWVHILIRERCKIFSHGTMSGAGGGMAPWPPWIRYCEPPH